MAHVQLLVAEAAAIPGFIARLSPLHIHQFATTVLGELVDVPFAPKSATPALWISIKVLHSPDIISAAHVPAGHTLSPKRDGGCKKMSHAALCHCTVLFLSCKPTPS